MSDLMGVQSPVQSPAQPDDTSLDSRVSDAITAALRSAPEIYQSPGLAVGIGQDAATTGSDPQQGAQAVAGVINNQAQQQAADGLTKAHGHKGWLGATLGFFGHAAHDVNSATGGAVGGAINLLGAGLREVQHQYRYLHDIEATHGPLAATLEGLGIAAGVAVGTLVEPGGGSVLGGEVAAGLLGRASYTDSWQRTTSGTAYKDPNTGQSVSMGRDVANLLGLQRNSKPFTIVSGVTDGLTDLYLDPLAKLGTAAGDIHSAEGAGGVLGVRYGGLAPHGATMVEKADDLERIYNQYGSVRRAFGQIADMSAGQVATNYPKFAPLARQLGEAANPEQVASVFRDALKAQEMVTDVVPSMTITRLPFHAAYQAVQDYEGVGSGPIRALTSRLPTNFDPETLALSSKTFDPTDDFAVKGIYDMARFSQSKRVAEAVASEYANTTDVGQRILIYRNAVRNMLIGKGLGEDDPYITHAMEQLLGGSAPGHDAIYGTNVGGLNISKLAATTDDPETAAAILANQTGKLAFPNFNEVIRQARAVGNFKNMYGAADDFLYKYFTQGVFKKLALLSGGFAQRIAAAEAIPAALREGTVSIIRDAVGANAAKLGYDTGADEIGHIAVAVEHVKAGLGRVTSMADSAINAPATTERLTDLVQANGGHIVPAAVDTTTHYSGEVGGAVVKAERDVKVAAGSVPPYKMMGDKFGLFGPGDQNFVDYWARALSETSRDEASQRAADAYLAAVREGQSVDDATRAGANAAAEHWRGQTPQTLSKYARSVRPSIPGADPFADWGRVIMENVKGLTHTPELTDATSAVIKQAAPNLAFLQDVSEGTATTRDVLAGIDQVDRPLMVKGRELIDVPHQNVLDRIANFGFSRVLDPIINKLSREPIYANEYLRQYAHLAPLVDSGEMGKAEAIQLAQVRSVHNVVPFIHNTLERSQFAELAHNFMPFYFAQEQAFRRFGRLLADDPGAFRQAQMMTSALVDAGHQTTDGQGNQWMVFPGAGFLDHTAIGVLGGLGIPVAGSAPVNFTGQVRSLSTILPGADASPKMGPLVAIAGHLLENWMPEARPAVTSVIGDVANSGSIWDQLIPNTTLKRAVQAFWGDHGRSFQSSMIQTIQSLAYQQNVAMGKWVASGHSPNDPGAPHLIPTADDGPMAQQDFINRIKNQTRINFLVKAMVGAVTPASPDMTIGSMKLRQEVQDEIKAQGSIAGGIQSFLAKHPDAGPYAVWQSQSPTGADIPSSKPAEDFINGNLATLRKYPYAGAWLIPQDPTGKFDQTVYNEQLAQGLRIKKAPDQFLKDLYVAAGNNVFYGQALQAHRAALAKASGSKDAVDALAAMQQDPNNRVLVTKFNAAIREAGSNDDTVAENRNFADWLSTFGQQNPVWWDDFKSATKDHERALAVNELAQMRADGHLVGPQAPGIARLLDDYEKYLSAQSAGQQDGWAMYSRTELKADWQAYVDSFAQQHPEMAPVARKVFRDL